MAMLNNKMVHFQHYYHGNMVGGIYDSLPWEHMGTIATIILDTLFHVFFWVLYIDR
jgi:hypothetical protein